MLERALGSRPGKGLHHIRYVDIDIHIQDSLVALKVKNLPAAQETGVRSLGQEDPLEEGMANPLQYSCLDTVSQ